MIFSRAFPLTRFFFSKRNFASVSESTRSPAILFLAIANPSEYNGTRHNVGQWAIEQMAGEAWPDFGSLTAARHVGSVAASSSESPRHGNILLAKTTGTFMNVSGPVVSKVWNKFKQEHSSHDPCLVILHDELQVQLGKVQVRRRGTSARGHNGLRSIDKVMGNNYTKLAIGINKAPGPNVADYVLSKFKPDEKRVLSTTTMPLLMQIMDEMVRGKHVFDKI